MGGGRRLPLDVAGAAGRAGPNLARSARPPSRIGRVVATRVRAHVRADPLARSCPGVAARDGAGGLLSLRDACPRVHGDRARRARPRLPHSGSRASAPRAVGGRWDASADRRRRARCASAGQRARSEVRCPPVLRSRGGVGSPDRRGTGCRQRELGRRTARRPAMRGRGDRRACPVRGP